MFPSVYCKFPDAFFGVGDLSKEARVGRWIAIIDAFWPCRVIFSVRQGRNGLGEINEGFSGA